MNKCTSDSRTVVPFVNLVKSSVVPEGTARLDSTIVAHEVLDLLTAEAPLAPEKVHEARFASSGAAVGAGAGAATAREAAAPRRRASEK